MRHPGVSMILATGGTAMVKAAYSSGTPAIGVGPGNAPAWVCADADVEAAARIVVASKAFDHGIICGSENNLVIDRSVRDAFTGALRRAGAAVLTAAECDRLARVAFDDRDGRLRRSVLGQAAAAIAAQAGIEVPAGTRLLVAPVPRQAVPGPYGREKLAPLLSLFTADGEDDGIGLCRQILGNGGRGHTAIIHTRSQRLQSSFARQMPVSRVLVNGPGSQGCIGLGNGLTPSLTLGCGTYGRTSTTDNVTYTHLINIKRIAHPLAGPGAPPPRRCPARACPASSRTGPDRSPVPPAQMPCRVPAMPGTPDSTLGITCAQADAEREYRPPRKCTHGPAREAGRVSVRYVVGFAPYNAEEVADRGEAGRLQRRRWDRNTVRSGQLPGGSGTGYHRRMVVATASPRARHDR